MTEQNITPSNQICKVQTNNKLIAFQDKLTAAPVAHYAQLHAAGEIINGRKAYSLIGIVLQDYSAGTGASNIQVRFNLSPDIIQYLLSVIKAGYTEFHWSSEKIFGDPDQQGYCSVQKFTIERHEQDNNGQILRCPWRIYIENGRGIKEHNRNGGCYCKGGSYGCDKKAFICLSDADLFTALNRVESYTKAWESVVTLKLIPAGLQMFREYLQSYRVND